MDLAESFPLRLRRHHLGMFTWRKCFSYQVADSESMANSIKFTMFAIDTYFELVDLVYSVRAS